jgi:cold shock CspA family protein
VATGFVKWFNAEKGFRFIAQDDGGPNAFVHYSSINATGFRSLEENQAVAFTISQGVRGPQAEMVEPLDRSKSDRGQTPPELEIDDEELGIELLNGRLRVVSVHPDGSVKVVDTPGQLHKLLYIASGEAVGWKNAVEELEDLINSPQTVERDLQRFFERNPQSLCGDAYEEARPHIVLQRDNDGPLIPDFALKPHNANALCDLLELKLPKAKLIRVNKNRVRLTSAIMEACAQL